VRPDEPTILVRPNDPISDAPKCRHGPTAWRGSGHAASYWALAAVSVILGARLSRVPEPPLRSTKKKDRKPTAAPRPPTPPSTSHQRRRHDAAHNDAARRGDACVAPTGVVDPGVINGTMHRRPRCDRRHNAAHNDAARRGDACVAPTGIVNPRCDRRRRGWNVRGTPGRCGFSAHAGIGAARVGGEPRGVVGFQPPFRNPAQATLRATGEVRGFLRRSQRAAGSPSPASARRGAEGRCVRRGSGPRCRPPRRRWAGRSRWP
jgi:hypothetical protein